MKTPRLRVLFARCRAIGLVTGTLLTLTPTRSAAQRGIGADTVGFASVATTLRSQPFDSAHVVASLRKGARVRLFMCSSAWCGASVGSVTGYIHEDSLLQPATPRAPATPEVAGRGYTNSQGEWVPSPRRSANGQAPSGASAHCRDGTYSFSRSRRGTCSHHGGVGSWL